MAVEGIERVAIVGAGLSGVIAARDLAVAGCAVHIFEKSRGAGGRMATRRAEGFAFDHGAQYFKAHGADFAAEIAAWRSRGFATSWGEDRFVGLPAMNAPVKALADGLPLTTGFTLARIEGGPGAWTLRAEEGAVAGPFDAVLVSAPAPQTATLLAAAAPDLAQAAGRARYAPCLTLMLAFEPDDVPSPLAVPERPEHAAIAWIAEDGTKPGRLREGARRIVVNATPEFSRAHLEEAPDAIAEALLAAVAPLLGATAAPVHAKAHRWRYALVEEPVGQACLWDPARGIGACGDWCLAGRVEAAFDSGRALARTVLGEG
ncbi:FAD-dependent oxidoreductase [Salinarimonas sp.]|uniref:NAD(P)/FAD-dependent oxidoreductase n=1 Tax=Salinarimonas sp. TaxID=2766526 RepID=UPI0032D8EE8B